MSKKSEGKTNRIIDESHFINNFQDCPNKIFEVRVKQMAEEQIIAVHCRGPGYVQSNL